MADLTLGDGTVVDVVTPALPAIVGVTAPDGIVVEVDGLPAATIADLAEETTARQDADTAHSIDPTPHPAYDDAPDLALIFENGLA